MAVYVTNGIQARTAIYFRFLHRLFGTAALFANTFGVSGAGLMPSVGARLQTNIMILITANMIPDAIIAYSMARPLVFMDRPFWTASCQQEFFTGLILS
jgi:hypothetical protein